VISLLLLFICSAGLFAAEDSYLNISIELMIVREAAKSDFEETKVIALIYAENLLNKGFKNSEIKESLEYLAKENKYNRFNDFPDIRLAAAKLLEKFDQNEIKDVSLPLYTIDIKLLERTARASNDDGARFNFLNYLEYYIEQKIPIDTDSLRETLEYLGEENIIKPENDFAAVRQKARKLLSLLNYREIYTHSSVSMDLLEEAAKSDNWYEKFLALEYFEDTIIRGSRDEKIKMILGFLVEENIENPKNDFPVVRDQALRLLELFNSENNIGYNNYLPPDIKTCVVRLAVNSGIEEAKLEALKYIEYCLVKKTRGAKYDYELLLQMLGHLCESGFNDVKREAQRILGLYDTGAYDLEYFQRYFERYDQLSIMENTARSDAREIKLLSLQYIDEFLYGAFKDSVINGAKKTLEYLGESGFPDVSQGAVRLLKNYYNYEDDGL
jgi:hypothetical protein